MKAVVLHSSRLTASVKSLMVVLLCLSAGSVFADVTPKAPACQLNELNTKKAFDWHQLQGKVVYVDFWASWCAPCAKSFPFLNTLVHDFNKDGLQVIAVNLDETPQDALDFLVKHPAQFTLLTDIDNQCAESFAVQAMPSSYLIDRKGNIRHSQLGFRSNEAQTLRILVQQLLKEKAVP